MSYDNWGDNYYKDANKGFRWSLFAGILAIILILLLATMWVFGWGFFSKTTANFRGETEVREQTVADGTFRIAQQDYFYDTCARVMSLEQQIDTMKADKSLPKSMRATNVLALTNQKNELVNDYNAKAANEIRGDFKAAGLPDRLNTNEKTECES